LSPFQHAQAQAQSTLEANKALVRRVFEDVINNGRIGGIAELYTPAFLDPARAARRFPPLAGMPVPLAEFRAAGPEIVATVEDMVAEGDLVATRIAWRGPHPPAGTHIEGQTLHLSRIFNGRIVEEWSAGWEWLDHHSNECFPRHKARPGN
jgi:predicted SnoaL-like aldol condensation-catalyzing enzyme